MSQSRQGRSQAALDIVAAGSMSRRKAAKWNGIAYSTLQSAVPSAKTTTSSVGRHSDLNEREELVMVSLLTKMAGSGTPLTNAHMVDAAAIIVSHMVPPRPLRVPFRDGSPGPKWPRGFRARHRDTLIFDKANAPVGITICCLQCRSTNISLCRIRTPYCRDHHIRATCI